MIKLESDKDLVLNVAMLVPHSSVVGPGLRTCIWMQGCSLKCPHCQNPEFQSHSPRNLILPSSLFDIVNQIQDVDGLTISGGEPLQQSKALSYFLEFYHTLNKSVIIFTGYSSEEIECSSNLYIQKILSFTDCLITGPYRQDLKILDKNVGSRNKRIWLITDRLKKEDFSQLSWEMDLNSGNSIHFQMIQKGGQEIFSEFCFDGHVLAYSGRRNLFQSEIANQLRKMGYNFE